LVSGYAHVFLQLSVVIVTLPFFSPSSLRVQRRREMLLIHRFTCYLYSSLFTTRVAHNQ